VEAPFISAVEDLVAHPAAGILVGELQSVVAVPLDVDDRDESIGKDAADGDVGLKLFERHAPSDLIGGDVAASEPNLSGFARPETTASYGGHPSLVGDASSLACHPKLARLLAKVGLAPEALCELQTAHLRASRYGGHSSRES